MGIEFLFKIFWMTLILTENFMFLKLGKSSSDFAIIAGWWPAGWKNLTKHI